MTRHLLLAVLLLGLLPAGAARADGTTVDIRFATLAPKGSAWAKVMDKHAAAIEKRTAGRVKVKYFYSGQQGDERDVIRKMKLGQLDGAALTSIGLGMIDGNLRVADLPLLYDNEKMVDDVRAKLAGQLDGIFRKDGYVFLGWGDVGWAYFYTNVPIKTLDDLRKTKMWVWTDDPTMIALFKRLKVPAVQLNVPDVFPQLQTGLIDGCYGSPLVAVAFQWFSKVKYASTPPFAYTVGVVIVRAEVFDKLSAEDQAIVREEGKAMGDELVKSTRRDNERTRKVMEKGGIQFLPLPDAVVAEMRKEATGMWQDLVGKLYNQESLDMVLKLAGKK
jgi:TRAP-type transport system periplasmic protein